MIENSGRDMCKSAKSCACLRVDARQDILIFLFLKAFGRIL
jgi:hypothetical protein